MPQGQPDYRALMPPEETPLEEYSYVERRAALFEMVEEAGHTRRLERSQTALAERFGVDQSTISRDLKRLREWKAERLGEGAAAELMTLKTKAIRELLDRGESAEAYHLMRKHYELLLETGAVPRASKEVEVDGKLSLVEALSQAAPDDIEVEPPSGIQTGD